MTIEYQHVVWVGLDLDRPSPNVPAVREWVEERINIFLTYTLPSILAQTHPADTIMLLCGQHNRKLTENYPWPSTIQVVHDDGKALIGSLRAEYVVQSRIDSDDMYHQTAFECIDGYVREFATPDKIEAFVFRSNIVWSRMLQFIGHHLRLCQPPPFVTKVFPRSVYVDWNQYYASTFVQHGSATRRRFALRPMEENKVCVVKHGTNWSHVKRGLDPISANSTALAKLRRNGGIIAEGPKAVAAILKDYGVSFEHVIAPVRTVYQGRTYRQPA